MSCKYSSAMLLLLSSYLILSLSLCLCIGPAVSSSIFAGVIINSRLPFSIQSRSYVGPPDLHDLQRPQGEVMPLAQETWSDQRIAAASHTGQQTWNVQRNVAEVPTAQQQQQHQPIPASASASAPAASPEVIVNGFNQAAGRPASSAGPTRPPAQYNYRERFSSVLFQPISRSNGQQNVVYSPATMHAMLGLLYGVSSNETAAELQRVGQFGNKQLDVAIEFEQVRRTESQLPNAQLIVANKLYYNREIDELNPRYLAFASQYYGSETEAVNMRKSRDTAAKINAWASDATRGIIRDLVQPSDIDEQTQALLVTAIYFKARWANEFSEMDTTAEKFRMGNNAAITVPMMYNDDLFDIAELPELDATALELPYAGTPISMLIILPNQVNGLAQLERQLERHDLNQIAARLHRDMVTVRLPKFRIEFELDMTGPLQQLGVRRMFTPKSQVDAMLLQPVRVSKILQKAFIDVNEAGSEAAAASYAKFVPLSLPVKSREFVADHPFVFAIRTPDSVLFIGHVVQPPQVSGRQ
ncbi:alaserpin [Drosophila virilis]|uniref:Serpin domain-containing protein n=1 Tax=Drosophila virilis TaxID=7244 RepID=B4MFF6_DROVI|nr:alaserpin [Drosophila virilis]EDW57325.2 uncharacterized protein Dvir_GJ14938 [Drosophila virilis]